MRNLKESVKVLGLINATTIAATTTGSAVDVEAYNEDCLIVASTGAVGTNGSVIFTVTGSLVATPSTYDQTLVTFASASATGIGAGRANLAGIKNIKGVATIPGSTTIGVAVSAIVTPFANATGNNSTTLA